MSGNNTTQLMIDAVESVIIRKAEAVGATTSPEDIHAIADLVRAISMCKKVNDTVISLVP